MALAAEQSSPPATAGRIGIGILRAVLALTLTALSASCFLKYMWWTACYSAWNGIPKLAQQWRDAGVRASLNGWGFILLEASVIVILTSLIKMRRFSGFSATQSASEHPSSSPCPSPPRSHSS